MDMEVFWAQRWKALTYVSCMGVISVAAGICIKGLALAKEEICVVVETETTS